jgi:hypothetical protein
VFLRKLGGFINSEMKRSFNKKEVEQESPRPSLFDYEEFIPRVPTDDPEHEFLVQHYGLDKSKPVITPSDFFTGKTMWKVFQRRAWEERKELFEEQQGRRYK